MKSVIELVVPSLVPLAVSMLWDVALGGEVGLFPSLKQTQLQFGHWVAVFKIFGRISKDFLFFYKNRADFSMSKSYQSRHYPDVFSTTHSSMQWNISHMSRKYIYQLLGVKVINVHTVSIHALHQNASSNYN